MIGPAVEPWDLEGADGQAILGDVHRPTGEAHGTLVICHGMMGYKDYGFMPLLADAAAREGWAAHRFNFSHSGMTRRIETFERADLFARDTWRKQAIDLRAVLGAIRSGELVGGGKPVVVFGHSRGGVTALLTTRWMLNDSDPAAPDALITASAPARSSRMSEAQAESMRRTGAMAVKSGRTGQAMTIDLGWLTEQEDDPAWHDVLSAAGRVAIADIPWLIVHGSGDTTIELGDAQELHRASGERARFEMVDGASHTFDCPNPAPADVMTVSTKRLVRLTLEFADAVRDGSISAGA